MVNNSVTLEDADRILDAVVEFPDINAAFQRIRPITNFRKDDDEARILYLCRRVNPGNQDVNGNVQGIKNGDLFVLKCKVQCVRRLLSLEKHFKAYTYKQGAITVSRRLDSAYTGAQPKHIR